MITLPRELKPGEFYCHWCKEFVPLDKETEHNKQHTSCKKKES